VTTAAAIPPTTSATLPPVALYIHVPFCVSLCPYCDFVVFAGAAARGPRARVEAFVAAVLVELGLRADALDAVFPGGRPPLETVYLGGGTPSLLPPDALAAILSVVRDRFGVADGAEVTVEANPGPDERGDAAAMRATGVTRLSIGAQAMSASGLRRLGRRHRVVDVVRSVSEAREGGIASVSLDLLYDTPDGTLADWIDTLEAALALGLPFMLTLRKVILPQAVRVVIPPTTSNCVSMFKDTSLASTVALPELLKEANNAQALYANPSPLIGAALVYVVFLWPMVRLVGLLERRLKADKAR